MERREALRLMGGASVFSVLSTDWLGATLRAQLADKSPGTLRTLNPEQNAIVVTMSDIIIPATATPGAKEAKVNEFIDLILTEWATEDEKKVFLAGLAEADRRTNELFGHGFVAAAPKEQSVVVQIFDEHLAALRSGAAFDDRDAWELTEAPPFFEQMRRLTLVGYYTSSIGQEQELKYDLTPGALHGCATLQPQPEVKP